MGRGEERMSTSPPVTTDQAESVKVSVLVFRKEEPVPIDVGVSSAKTILV